MLFSGKQISAANNYTGMGLSSRRDFYFIKHNTRED
jgi:hypothetical protein